MESAKDAYGRELLAYLKNKDGYEVIERDDGFFGISSGPQKYFSEYRKWPSHEKRAIKFAKGRILDIGCGAGRHSLYLQKKGCDVTGIDVSPLAVKICRQRGLKKAEVMSINEVTKFKPAFFDTILMLGNNFGLFGSFKGVKVLLKKFYRITFPKAVIIAESNDPSKTRDPAHLEYQKLNRKRGRPPGQIKIRVRFRKYVGRWFQYLLVSQKEMEEILKGTGWRIKKFINSNNSSYIAIIEK